MRWSQPQLPLLYITIQSLKGSYKKGWNELTSTAQCTADTDLPQSELIAVGNYYYQKYETLKQTRSEKF